ncbi:MAG TPA: ribbon-helix-helix protein, CopG family [Acidobacteriota bacterium]|nr:ribbon-helix-helix protein, CopG family [Acidobacteriota bacterium]
MKSVRLDKSLEAKLQEAARISGQSVSSLIRVAIEERCRDILGQRLAPRLADVTGVIKSGGGRARRSGEAFAEHLRSKKGDRK